MQAQLRYLLTGVVFLLFLGYFMILSNKAALRATVKPKHLISNEKAPDTTRLPHCDDLSEKVSNPNSTGNPQHLRDVLHDPLKLSHFEFRKCDMQTCFDFSLCKQVGPMRVHVVPKQETEGRKNFTAGESNQIYDHIINIIKESVYYEPNREKACLFVLERDTLDRDPLSRSFLPDLGVLFNSDNRYGMNHLVFNLYSGSWPDYREDDFAGIKTGAAILAKASNSFRNHRIGFDISLPLFSYQHAVKENNLESAPGTDLEETSAQNKSFFLSFKGKRYVYGSGSDTRNNLYHLNNQRDVIMLTTCRHGKKWRESSDERCSEDELEYDKYDFNDLMRESTFCLTPRGRRLGSFRYLEAISYGCIPVVLSDGWVKPFDEIINWSCASIQYDEDDLLLVPDMLRDINDETRAQMSRNCKTLFRKYFATMEKIILTTISIVEERIKKHLVTGSSIVEAS